MAAQCPGGKESGEHSCKDIRLYIYCFIFEIDFYTFEMTYICNLCIVLLLSLSIYTVYNNHLFYEQLSLIINVLSLS